MNESVKIPILIINPIFNEEIGICNSNGNLRNSFNSLSGNLNEYVPDNSFRNNNNINADNLSNSSYRKKNVNISDKIFIGIIE